MERLCRCAAGNRVRGCLAFDKNGELFVIRPEEELPVSRVEKNPEKLRKAYELGRRTAEKHLTEIKKFLGGS